MYLHCPRCSIKLSAADYSELKHCPQCLAHGVHPAPELRRHPTGADVHRRVLRSLGAARPRGDHARRHAEA